MENVPVGLPGEYLKRELVVRAADAELGKVLDNLAGHCLDEL